jgi:hypothetical protein
MNAVGLWVVKAETAFSAVANFFADGVFTSDFTNYKLIIRYETSSTGTMGMQFRAATVDTATNYNFQLLVADDTVVAGGRSTAQTSGRIANNTNGAFISFVTVEICGPQLASATTYMASNVRNSTAYTTTLFEDRYGNQSASTQFDGVKILISTGTMTGTYTLYGYNK